MYTLVSGFLPLIIMSVILYILLHPALIEILKMLYSIPLYKYTRIYLSSILLMDI